jgi:hypothetical protein
MPIVPGYLRVTARRLRPLAAVLGTRARLRPYRWSDVRCRRRPCLLLDLGDVITQDGHS